VLALAGRLNALKIDGVIETVPTIRSLSIYYEPLTVSRLARAAGRRYPRTSGRSTGNGPHLRYPVCYDPELAPDLEQVALQCNLHPADVVEIHSSRTYHVYMLGFCLASPTWVIFRQSLLCPGARRPAQDPAGSLGIGGKLTCIYPMATPCGWHLIGRSPSRFGTRLSREERCCGPRQSAVQAVSLHEYRRVCSDGIVALPQPDTSH